MTAVICLSIILSSETDAQPTVGVDETASCSSSTLEEVASVVKTIALNQKENAKNVEKLLASNPSNEVEPSKQTFVSALVSNCVPLLIQQNVDGLTDFFNRSWAEFKVGFNDTRGNYWLGNELLIQLTLTLRYKLRFDLQNRANHSDWYAAEYSTFIVLSETTNYTLTVAGFSGYAAYDAFSYSNGMMFTTYDRDNDPWTNPSYRNNCAVWNAGGFWYKGCSACRVNTKRGHSHDFGWWRLPGGSFLQSSRMWLQCK